MSEVLATAPDMQAAAVDLAEQGFRVFPLVAGEKVPAVADFPTVATTDRARAARWWAPTLGDPDSRNVGVATGQGLIVLDFDCKEGQVGHRSLFELEMQGLPATRTIRTPSGGVHKYLRVPEGCRLANSVGKIAANTDVRAENGYVVAPGSVVGGKHPGQYVVEQDLPIADAPAWLIERCGRARERAADATPLVDLDTPEAISRAVEWLKHDAEPSFKGSGGDKAAYATACGVRDFGVSELTCLELMLDHWNERGEPQWQPDRLAVKVENAYRYATSPAGVASADAEFGALPPENDSAAGIPATAKGPKFKLLDFNDSADLAEAAAADPLIDGLLDRGAMSVLYGASNEGKTFVMLDLAYHIAMGRPWNGRRVHRGPVVYVVAEGGNQIHKRTKALRERYGAEGVLFDLIVAPVNLLRAGEDLSQLIAAVRAAEAKRGAKVELVVVDTLSRALAGGDENSSVDMGAIVRNLDRLRVETGAHLAVVHHTGKDATRGARGHSLLRAATDTELEVAGGRLTTRKQRDMAERVDLAFSLESIDVGRDREGRPLMGAVVAWKEETEFGSLPETGAEAIAREAFGEWRNYVERLAEMERVEARAYVFKPAMVEAFFSDSAREGRKASRASVRRWLDRWGSAGQIRKAAYGQWLITDWLRGSEVAQS